MDSVYALVTCVTDAVGPKPNPDWRQSLLTACDTVESEHDELLAANKMLLAALENLLDATERNVLHVDAINARVKAREAACEAIAKVKGGE